MKKNQKTEDSLKGLWDNIKHTSICIIGAHKEQDLRKYLKG